MLGQPYAVQVPRNFPLFHHQYMKPTPWVKKTGSAPRCSSFKRFSVELRSGVWTGQTIRKTLSFHTVFDCSSGHVLLLSWKIDPSSPVQLIQRGDHWGIHSVRCHEVQWNKCTYAVPTEGTTYHNAKMSNHFCQPSVTEKRHHSTPALMLILFFPSFESPFSLSEEREEGNSWRS